jgi:hypothetical protein
VTQQVADALAAELALKRMKADIGGNLLIRLFGLTDGQAQDPCVGEQSHFLESRSYRACVRLRG